MKKYGLIDQEEVFEYLDELRKSGVTNMFGAGTYLELQFDFDRYLAREALRDWMNTFNERHNK